MNNKFFIKNRQKLSNLVSNNSIILLFSGKSPYRSADQKYKYTPNRNFYYLTGIDKENFIFLMTKIDGKVEEKIFIGKSDPRLEKWIGKRMTKDEVKEKSGIENVQYIDEFEEHFNFLILSKDFKELYINLENREWDSLPSISHVYAEKITSKYPHLRINNVYHTICNLRTIKSEEEVREIEKAISITNEGIKSLMKNVKPGMTEYQLEAYFDFTVKSLGVRELSFNTIIASGKNATVLHYEDNNCEIRDNSLVLVDLGVEYGYYCSDISRTFPASGKFSDRQKEIYNAVLKAQINTINSVRPGITFKELNDITKKVLAQECKKIGLIKDDDELARYYYHGVSHYLGLDTHDVGDYDRKLEPGMVLTIEPGLYIDEEGIGVRIEDDVLVTEEGCKNLSSDIIKTVDEIEKFMIKNS